MSEKTSRPGRSRLAGERVEVVNLLERIHNYGFVHVHTCMSSLGRLYRNPLASTLTVLVMAIALALPTGLHVLVKNARQASGTLEATHQISVFLKPELSNEVGRKLAEKLAAHPKIAQAESITKEMGLRDFQSYSGFGEALKALDFNPLPFVISIRPKDALAQPEAVAALVAEIKRLPEVDIVQADMDWVIKLHTILSILRHTAFVLGGLLSLAVLFIVGNTIRLELQQRSEEIAIMQLMGATDRFIRRPFLYSGMWFGLLAGTVAWLLVTIALLMLNRSVRRLAEWYGGHFELTFLGWADFGWLIASAIGLGLVGTWIAVQAHLRRLEPSRQS